MNKKKRERLKNLALERQAVWYGQSTAELRVVDRGDGAAGAVARSGGASSLAAQQPSFPPSLRRR